MSSVVSSTKISDRPQADGRRYVRVRFIVADHDDAETEVFIGPRLVASDFDVDAWMAAHGGDVLEQMARQEDEGGKDFNTVANPQTYALNPKWSTTKRIAKTLVYWMMEEKDPRIVIYLEPLLDYIKANYNATQIANFLDITTAKVLRMNARIDAILSDTGTVKDQLTAFDSEEGGF